MQAEVRSEDRRPIPSLMTSTSSVAPAFDSIDAPSPALISTCVHCGFCLPTCPTYLLWGEEMDSPRGRIYLMKAASEGRIPMSDAFVGHMDACLGCMACVTACPSGVEYGPLIERTRAQIERRHPRGVFERLLRGALFRVIPYPSRLRVLFAPLVVCGGAVRAIGTSAFAGRLPGFLRAVLSLAPRVSWSDVTARVAEKTPAAGARRASVGLLTGCVQRVAFAHVNRATVNVLAAEGCDVLAPSAQGCCGALALHAGRLDDARAFARRIIAAFDDPAIERVAVNAAGCGSAMKEYGQLLVG